MKEHIVSLERQCWSNSRYSRRECLQVTGIPDKTDHKDLENTVLNIFRKLDVEIDSSNNENYRSRVTEQGYRARGPNVQLLNSQNEKMQIGLAIARKR